MKIKSAFYGFGFAIFNPYVILRPDAADPANFDEHFVNGVFTVSSPLLNWECFLFSLIANLEYLEFVSDL